MDQAVREGEGQELSTGFGVPTQRWWDQHEDSPSSALSRRSSMKEDLGLHPLPR